MLGGLPVPGILNETFQFTGKSAGCPAFLPVGRGGEESRPCNPIYNTGSLAPWAENFYLIVSLDLEFGDDLF
jgi:hypothetical protein